MVSARENYDWFKSNLSELVKQYADKHIVIKDKTVIGVYGTMNEALTKTTKTEEPGTYIIQLCTEDGEKTTQVFHSRVRLAKI